VLVGAAASGMAFSGPGLADEAARWSYVGDRGPEGWAAISDDFAPCALGRQQSPIDLVPTHDGMPEPVETRWQAFAPEVVNNGHTIEAEVQAGSYTLFGGRRYDLVQFHFHAPSEHTLAGGHTPLEAHFVHRSGDGDLLVLGVFLVAGESSAALERVWEVMPTAPGRALANQPLDPAELLPGAGPVFRYAGSLTTPPCSEVVSWVVFERPLEVSAGQIAAFEAIFQGNRRPLQPRNRRFVLYGPVGGP
jgi:carbonic anhydrase